MYVYLTSGTPEFMESIQQKHSNENMILLYGADKTVLLHESEKKSVFATPKSYEIVHQVGQLEQNGFYALNYIPVKEESHLVFEDNFLKVIEKLKQEPGFISYRLLRPRPFQDEAYISLTVWNGPHSFEAWKASQTYKETFEHPKKNINGVDTGNIFVSHPYVKTYTTTKLEEEEEE